MNLYERIEEAVETNEINSMSSIVTLAVNMTIDTIKRHASLTDNPVEDGQGGWENHPFYRIYVQRLNSLTDTDSNLWKN